MAIFHETQAEFDEFRRMRTAWADTLRAYAGRQCFGVLAQDDDDGLKVCALGALAIAAMESKPQQAADILDHSHEMPPYWLYDAVGGSFVTDLIARTACLQNGLSRTYSTYVGECFKGITHLNDHDHLDFCLFAQAIEATEPIIAEHTEIINTPSATRDIAQEVYA